MVLTVPQYSGGLGTSFCLLGICLWIRATSVCCYAVCLPLRSVLLVPGGGVLFPERCRPFLGGLLDFVDAPGKPRLWCWTRKADGLLEEERDSGSESAQRQIKNAGVLTVGRPQGVHGASDDFPIQRVLVQRSELSYV